jgi:hypothetical protein
MAFAERSRVVEKQGREPTDRPSALFTGVLLVAVVATLGLRSILSIEALAPAVTSVVFTLGAATAGLALLCRRNQTRTLWFDVAGTLTFVGVAVSILIEPDQMVRLVTLSDQPD